MKKVCPVAVRCDVAAVIHGSGLSCTQNPNYNNGPVWRVICDDVKAGMGDAFWTDIRQNFQTNLRRVQEAGLGCRL